MSRNSKNAGSGEVAGSRERGAGGGATTEGTKSTKGSIEGRSLVRAAVAVSPRSLLLPYQVKWVEDESRFKYGLWSRQTGKDFSSGCEIVEDCLKNPKTNWLIGAAGERQALESLSKCKEWAEAYKLQIEDYAEDRAAAQALIQSGTITWANGSRVIAIPANPNTVRGYSANVLLTEFAFLEDPDATWRAILPSITNPLRGGEKKVRIITTPNGIGNKAHELWVLAARATEQKANGTLASNRQYWSAHKVTIHDAVAAGLPIDIEQLREAINDAEGWAQEFECEFLDQASVLLPYELIASCESSEASGQIELSFFSGEGRGARGERNRAPVFIGVDFGRKRDLSVAWSCELVGDVLHTREVLELAKMSTPDQIAALRPRVARAQRVCVDYTGPGVGLGDYLVKEFQEWNPEQDKFGKIELCNFTNSFKQEVFPLLKVKFEEKRVRIPISRVIREDLHAISRVVTQTGQVSYRAPHTEDGHSDRATALALCVRAGSGRVSSFAYKAVARGEGRGARREGGLL